MAVDDPGDDVGEVGLRIDATELAGLDQRGDDRPVLATAVGAGEECILPVQRNRAVILPMSGRKSKFVTVGTPSMGGAFGASLWSGVPAVRLLTSR
jgi:hypothetical protein